jgi:hypothetical protein
MPTERTPVNRADPLRRADADRNQPAPLTAIERAVWDAWSRLPEDPDGCPSPVKTVAAELDLEPVDVSMIVLPPEIFGPWRDDQEPDLP